MYRVISRITILITHIKGLIPPNITTHEPPSKGSIRVPLKGPSSLGWVLPPIKSQPIL